MEKKIQEILAKWLEIDFYYVANKVGFISKNIMADKEIIFFKIWWVGFFFFFLKKKKKFLLCIYFVRVFH